MQRKRLKVMSLVASAAAVTGLAVFGTETAFAGSNGQQIQLCKPNADFTSARLLGPNQDGVQTDTTVTLKDQCTTVANFFWNGNVNISWQGGLSPAVSTTCSVPKSSPTDVVTCDAGNEPPVVKKTSTVSAQDAEAQAGKVCTDAGFRAWTVKSSDTQESPEPPFNTQFIVEVECTR
jgi:hypothetical protein